MNTDLAQAGPSAAHARVAIVALGLAVVAVALTWLLCGSRPGRLVDRSPRPAAAPAAPTADVPGAEFPGLPRYPGSVRIAYSQRVEGGLVVTEANYAAQAELDAVRELYRQVFQSEGWSVVDVRFSQDRWTFFVVQGAREALIEIESRGALVEVALGLSEPWGDGGPVGVGGDDQVLVGGSKR